jgi:Ran GTPase-activating protein (RanGAP) involved in mRNA processing and transport
LQTVAKSLAGKKLVQFNASDNAFGPRGLVACKPALLPCLDTLERAYFCNNGLSEHAGESCDEFIIRAAIHTTVDGSTRVPALRVVAVVALSL